jgi:hypothetical protein
MLAVVCVGTDVTGAQREEGTGIDRTNGTGYSVFALQGSAVDVQNRDVTNHGADRACCFALQALVRNSSMMQFPPNVNLLGLQRAHRVMLLNCQIGSAR